MALSPGRWARAFISSCAALLLCSASPTSGQERQLEVLYDFAAAPGHPVAGLVRGPDGTLYGSAYFNPPTQVGGIFSLTPRPDGSYAYRLLHEFGTGAGSDGGRLPVAGVTLAADGHLYGVTREGGANNAGTVFRLTTAGVLTVLHSFDGVTGRDPMGRLLQATDGHLYGTTAGGGAYGLGTIFRITTAGVFTRMHSFLWLDGAVPTAGLTQANDGHLYGTTLAGGWFFAGTIFRMTLAGRVTRLHEFSNADGRAPAAALVQTRDGNLYGTTHEGSPAGYGTVFRISTSGTFTSLHAFPAGPGTASKPTGGLVEATDGFLYGTVSGGAPTGYWETEHHRGAIYRITTGGATEVIHTFNIMDGMLPLGDLIEGLDGALYGGTVWGGAERHGSIFRFTPAHGVATIHSFTGRVENPQGLILASDGHFYGVAHHTGPGITGSIFKVAHDGTYVPLRTLLKTEGTNPSQLLQASDGYFYGTTRTGGVNGSGTVFRMTPEGEYSIVASFGRFDGISGFPLIEGSDGMFYGTMEYGESFNGSVFRMTPAGVVTTVHAFTGVFGSGVKSIIQARDGHLYGLTTGDGASGRGSIFRVTTSGAFTRLHSFAGADGEEPVGRLLQAADGHLYGTTFRGGAFNLGTIFRITMAGVLTTLHSFSGSDGARPYAALFEAPDGLIYGTSNGGAQAGQPAGTVFTLDPETLVVAVVHSFAADGTEGAPGPSGVLLGLDGAVYGAAFAAGHVTGGPRGYFYRLRAALAGHR